MAVPSCTQASVWSPTSAVPLREGGTSTGDRSDRRTYVRIGRIRQPVTRLRAWRVYPAPPLPWSLSPFVSPSPCKGRCRAKLQRNDNPRVGGSSPSSGMRSACKSLRFSDPRTRGIIPRVPRSHSEDLAELRSLPRVSLTFMSPGMSPKDGAASRLASETPVGPECRSSAGSYEARCLSAGGHVRGRSRNLGALRST
jgi:hypothetical protein